MTHAKKGVIIFTGGGTAGHVFPAFPVVARLRADGWRVEWIGSRNGIEAKLAESIGLRFHRVPVGKLRRYFSFRNFTDLFSFLTGIFCSLVILLRLRPRPAVVVSKGGFAGVGPIVAARILGIPRVSHESDITPGLATRLNMAFGARIMVSYQRTLDFLPLKAAERAVVTGNPIRDEILSGERNRLREVLESLKTQYEKASVDTPSGIKQTVCGGDFDGFLSCLRQGGAGLERPVVLVCGGSLGARRINKLVDDSLDQILNFVFVIHQRGSADLASANKNSIQNRKGYVWADFFGEEFAHILAAADLAVGRAGAGFVWEIAGTCTPGLLIPLKTGSRGDQFLNAQTAAETGFAVTMDESASALEFAGKLLDLVKNVKGRETMRAAAKTYNAAGAADAFFSVLREYG